MRTAVLLFAAALLLGAALGELVVYYPRTLRERINPIDGVIQSSLANFGNIPYGHSIIGKLWYDPENADG